MKCAVPKFKTGKKNVVTAMKKLQMNWKKGSRLHMKDLPAPAKHKAPHLFVGKSRTNRLSCSEIGSLTGSSDGAASKLVNR